MCTLYSQRNVGIWKVLFQNQNWISDNGTRATYLVEALGHCAECQTPRNILGALDTKKWMKGAENPSGRGRIPSLSPDDLDWSLEDIIEWFHTRF